MWAINAEGQKVISLITKIIFYKGRKLKINKNAMLRIIDKDEYKEL